jgi:DNA polymerase-1
MYTDWQSRLEEYFCIDIETDDLKATVVWVMCWQNVRTNEKGKCVGHKEIEEFFERTAGAIYVGHNILKFDGPVLNALCGASIGPSNCIDTLVLSTLYHPSIPDGHSLGAWGSRMGKPKIEFSDFSRLSEEMITYCYMDVEITAELFRRLIRTMVRIGFTEQSMWIQHRFTELLERQHKNGFMFDGPRALVLYSQLRSLEERLTHDIRSIFPPTDVLIRENRPVYTKSGRPTVIYERDCDRYRITLDETGSTYSAFESVDFNIGSPPQRTQKLLDLGWEPQEFTKTGLPKPFDKGSLSPSLEAFLEDTPVPEILMIAKWMAINGRANMINTWLENWNENDGCIHGKLFTADTLRLRHQAPNTANIPAVRVDKTGRVLRGEEGYFTYEARDLWIARAGRVLVGTDASGLELRMLAHYLNRPDFTREVVEGDPHQYNADVVGITRPQAKTLIYAIMYGAAAPKIAKTLGVPVREGARIRNMFLERLGLKDLIDECKAEQARGRVELVDGSFVICPSPHAALNYKLQGGGARVMGLSACLADREVRRNAWDVLKVGDIHDEDQSDVAPDIADDFGRMRVDSIRQAGELLKMDVPLDGEYKKGKTWAETH